MTTIPVALTVRSPEPETNVTLPRAWAADLAQVGAGSAALLSMLGGASATFVATAVIASAAIGAAMGWLAPVLLSWRVRRKPVLLLLGAGAGLGASWGAASAVTAALATGALGWTRAAMLGASAGLWVMGAFWLPATLLRASGRSTLLARAAILALCPLIAVYLSRV